MSKKIVELAMDHKLIIFSSMRGHKISTPLKAIGVDHEFIPCKSSAISIIKSAIKLIPLLLKRNKTPLLLIDTAMNIGFVGWLMATVFRVKYIYRARGDAYQEGIITKRRFHTWFYKHVFLPQAIGCIPVSHYLQSKVEEVTKKELNCNVVNTPHLSCDEPNLELGKRNKTILMVTGFGFITKIESIFSLLPALKNFVEKHSDYNILILGGGTHLESVVKYKEKNFATDAIHFAGHTSNIQEYYKTSYALLHITDLDAFPSVINEARACGLPVLASDLGGCSEQIVRGKTGLLFSNKKQQELFASLEDITNPNTWNKLSKDGSEFVHDHHNIDKIGQSLLMAINTLLSEKS